MGGLSDRALAVANGVERSAGSYLQSTVREMSVTCTVCGTPVANGFERCIPCAQHAKAGVPLADRVGSLVYAVKPDSQTYLLVYNYKSSAPGPTHEPEMKGLLALGLRGHAECAKTLAGATTSAWCVVPSTKGRAKLHELVSQLASPTSRRIEVTHAESGRQDRDLHPDQWAIGIDGSPPEHVLVIDDSWVTGSHAQSVASALKTSGVPQVSVFTVANVLDPTWEPNMQFIKQRLSKSAFDKTRCPWTGGACP